VYVYVSMHVMYTYASTLVYAQKAGGKKRVSCARFVAGLFMYFPEECGRWYNACYFSCSTEDSDIITVVDNVYISRKRGDCNSVAFLLWMFCLTVCLKGH